MLNQVHDVLLRLIREGDEQNFVVFTPQGRDHLYVQCMSGKGSNEVYAEAVSNYYLPSEEQLTVDQMDTMERFGWEAPEKEGNYSYTWRISTEDVLWGVAEHTLQTLQDVFGLSEGEALTVNLSIEG